MQSVVGVGGVVGGGLTFMVASSRVFPRQSRFAIYDSSRDQLLSRAMSAAPRLLIIVNPAAARARVAWPQVQRRLDAHRIKYEVQNTQSAGHGTAITTQALRDGYDLIGVLGGDGTLSEAVNGFFDL